MTIQRFQDQSGEDICYTTTPVPMPDGSLWQPYQPLRCAKWFGRKQTSTMEEPLMEEEPTAPPLPPVVPMTPEPPSPIEREKERIFNPPPPPMPPRPPILPPPPVVPVPVTNPVPVSQPRPVPITQPLPGTNTAPVPGTQPTPFPGGSTAPTPSPLPRPRTGMRGWEPEEQPVAAPVAPPQSFVRPDIDEGFVDRSGNRTTRAALESQPWWKSGPATPAAPPIPRPGAVPNLPPMMVMPAGGGAAGAMGPQPPNFGGPSFERDRSWQSNTAPKWAPAPAPWTSAYEYGDGSPETAARTWETDEDRRRRLGGYDLPTIS